MWMSAFWDYLLTLDRCSSPYPAPLLIQATVLDGHLGKATIYSATRSEPWQTSQLPTSPPTHPHTLLSLGSCWGQQKKKAEPSPRRSSPPRELTVANLNRYSQLNIPQTNSLHWMSVALRRVSSQNPFLSFSLLSASNVTHPFPRLPFGNALYTHPMLLTLILGGCNPAGKLQRWFHRFLLNASFPHHGAASLWTTGRQRGWLCTLRTWDTDLICAGWVLQVPGLHFMPVSSRTQCQGPLQLSLALVLRIPSFTLAHTDICIAFLLRG